MPRAIAQHHGKRAKITISLWADQERALRDILRADREATLSGLVRQGIDLVIARHAVTLDRIGASMSKTK